jgi:2-dehydro-3-deoxy-D-gluconate 5-dehydrogenase
VSGRGPFDLSGRTALVLGASRGIGAALAGGLAAAGARVALAGRSASDLEDSASAIRKSGGAADVYTHDANDLAGLASFVDRVRAGSGGLDVFVHVAGTNRRKPSTEMTEDDWDAILDLNLKSFFFSAQAVGRYWIESRRFMSGERKGKVLGVGSLTSFIGLANMAPYAASKSGLLGVTRTLAIEWAAYGICVNAIAPGYIATEFTRPVREDAARSAWILGQTPMRRWGTPDDLVGGAVYLASPASDFVTGQTLAIDGGWLAG